ncbi:unnamed protein product [Miscanthus lutarioriparius]|uniref:H(+)-exporting diphosphatase n=1 Tax=Miscanthus lutarioriparius TaxID=422564 RepID=A0A811MN38_9POAL|nr:unnamed protein product [Miscanthus lutarioriparius]
MALQAGRPHLPPSPSLLLWPLMVAVPDLQWVSWCHGWHIADLRTAPIGNDTTYLKDEKVSIDEIKLTPLELSELIASIKNGTISAKISKEILAKLIAKGGTVKVLRTSTALIAYNVTEASTTAASTIAKVAVTTSAQSTSIVNTSYVDHAMAVFQPSVVVLHAHTAGRGATLSAWVATIALASTSSSVPTSGHKLFSGPLNSYAALVQWIKSLVAADDILPKHPWVSFATGTLFTVGYNYSNPRNSLQYAWQLLLDGEIYTTAADVGADLVGKVERNIPEDDLRKPAVIADNVGDNVGDIAGMGYGAAVAALGMLSTIATVSDNAGGIDEMAGMSHKICGRTDALDAAGNTPATIGKGFAIGSAALVSLALFGAFVSRVAISTVDVLTPKVFIGLIVGAMLPYWFSVMTMKSVGSAALKMVEELYRQLNTIPGLMEGTTKPDYATCVKVSTDASVKEMISLGGHD